ncbi:DUF5304 domain-containing protein [Streptomyces purpurogeneiscleroticus]|uniref:DUF5304 domain-containing protein n=1 Tax=Streptomyces purpurogeneiscleroticus TaxID=68259 RepID=UPI001CBA8C0C|nr:DUF5304 domain-containing protein [Streptomyces purpurogeneiscleroticus]MBZ4016953.1 hypothetical protein [Streptomyces purpurogeneiscleroticus]
MTDDTERPADNPQGTDDNAWEQACAEDLAAERARRRAEYGRQPGSAAEELRKLAEAVTDKLAGIQLPGAAGGLAAKGAVDHLLRQARAAVEPVIERNPDVFDHLAAAGSELLAAYRSAVEAGERRWTQGAADGRDATARGPQAEGPERPGDGRDDEGPAGAGGSERIDLD